MNKIDKLLIITVLIMFLGIGCILELVDTIDNQEQIAKNNCNNYEGVKYIGEENAFGVVYVCNDKRYGGMIPKDAEKVRRYIINFMTFPMIVIVILTLIKAITFGKRDKK